MKKRSDRAVKAATACQAQWLHDMELLWQGAGQKFADIAWCDADSPSDRFYGHKGGLHLSNIIVSQSERFSANAAILYARSPGNLLARFLQGQPNSQQHVPCSSRSSLQDGSWSHNKPQPPSAESAYRSSISLRDHSSNETHDLLPIPLSIADRAILTSLLQYLYTSHSAPEALLNFLFEEQLPDGQDVSPIERLRQDMLFMWRSKLYADVQILLVATSGAQSVASHESISEEEDASNSTFTVHRIVLLRSPYFKSLLLSHYADSSSQVLTLPSPPFTASALHFTLGYLYCGTLHFSSRSYDLDTALNIWRCADYLQLDLLKLQVECDIEGLMATDALKAARVLSWALVDNANCSLLEKSARELVTSKFGSAWRKEIGLLDKTVQQSLVEQVCSRIDAVTAVSSLRELKTARNAVSSIRDLWARHVVAMLEAVDTYLKRVMLANLDTVTRSDSFAALLEGRTFSRDLLDQMLQEIVDALREDSAPSVYQTIVGNILLRENGIQVDARIRVEDCRRQILSYLSKRHMNIREMRGFDGLETWALKELADELSVEPDDLLSSSSDNVTRKTTTSIKGRRKLGTTTKPEESRLHAATNSRMLTNTSAERVAKTALRKSSPTKPAASEVVRSVTRARSSSATSKTSNHPAIPLSSRASFGSLGTAIEKNVRMRPKAPLTTSPNSSPTNRSHQTPLPLHSRKNPSRQPVDTTASFEHVKADPLPSRLKTKPTDGVSLNVGIRCVVSFARGGKATGMVWYLGPVTELGQGQFIGVEVDKGTIAYQHVDWTDGTVGDVDYFVAGTSRGTPRGVFVRPKQVMYLL